MKDPYKKKFINKLGNKKFEMIKLLYLIRCVLGSKYLIEILDEISNGKTDFIFFLKVIIENKDHEY